MRPNDHAHVVFLHELIDSILPESQHILQIEDIVFEILGVVILIFVNRGVTPENLKRDFMLVRLRILNDFERSWDLLDFFDGSESCSDAAVQAQNRIFNNGGEWHVLEDFVQALEDRIRIVDVFIEFLRAFVREAHRFVHSAVFHVAAEQVDLIEVLQFQCEQQENNFELHRTSSNVIPQEQVLVAVDVLVDHFAVARRTEVVEESHEILVLPVDIPEDLNRSPHAQHHWLAFEHFLYFVAQFQNHVLAQLLRDKVALVLHAHVLVLFRLK